MMALPPLLLVLLSILRNRYVFSVPTLFFLSLIGFISRTLPPTDLIPSLSSVLRPKVSACLCCLTPCFKSVSGLRPTNAAEIALQELERYRTPLVPARLGSANVDVALPGLFQARKKARALV